MATLHEAATKGEEGLATAEQVEIRAFRAGSLEDAAAFRDLNMEWIEQLFGMEEHDHEMLGDPEEYILRPGGHIVMAFVGERAMGCCALIPARPGVFEVAKMAVSEELRGRGIGRKVLEATLAQARARGAAMLTLATNSRLGNAVHLYESIGFRHLPPEPSPYTRANVFMELAL
jgi:GNAT superfamily N-acetyltransferase